MKRIAALVLALSLFLCACGKSSDEGIVSPKPTEENVKALLCREIAEFVLYKNAVDLSYLKCLNDSYDSKALSAYIENVYSVMPSEWTDCVIYRADAADNAFELSIFELSSLAEADTVLSNLEEYLIDRQGDFFGYNPEQAAIVEDSIVCISEDGAYAGVFISSDPELLRDVFNECIGTGVLETPSSATESFSPEEIPEYWEEYIDPEIDDMSIWDSSALVAAVKSGSDEGLDGQNKRLFKKVNNIIKSIITDDMSELEMEKAVYDWLTSEVEYDHRHYDIPNAAPRKSYEPYGAIVDGRAVCLGFATAFQLFMDVLDIECITVVGAAFSSREDHAWNMVEIDGKWYCADATWDAGAHPDHYNYFNVSSDYMAMTGHQWDYEAYPISYSENDGSWADELWIAVE